MKDRGLTATRAISRDVTILNAVANWYLFTDRHRTFRRVIPGALTFSTWRNGDGALESGQYAVWLQWDTKEGGGGWVEPKLFVEDDGADIHLTWLRVRGALDARASGNAFVQYNSTTGRLALDVRLRYSFSEGTDVWVVYDDGLDVERAADPDGVRPPLSTGRALVVK